LPRSLWSAPISVPLLVTWQASCRPRPPNGYIDKVAMPSTPEATGGNGANQQHNRQKLHRHDCGLQTHNVGLSRNCGANASMPSSAAMDPFKGGLGNGSTPGCLCTTVWLPLSAGRLMSKAQRGRATILSRVRWRAAPRKRVQTAPRLVSANPA
jgi:hypothetical protein